MARFMVTPSGNGWSDYIFAMAKLSFAMRRKGNVKFSVAVLFGSGMVWLRSDSKCSGEAMSGDVWRWLSQVLFSYGEVWKITVSIRKGNVGSGRVLFSSVMEKYCGVMRRLS